MFLFNQSFNECKASDASLNKSRHLTLVIAGICSCKDCTDHIGAEIIINVHLCHQYIHFPQN